MKKLVKDSALVTFGAILRKAAGFIFLIAIARFYPVETFGLFNYVLYFVTLGWTVIDLGLEKYLSLKVVKKKENLNKYFNFGIALRAVAALVTYAAMLLIGLLINLEGRKLAGIAIYGLHLFPGLVFVTMNNVFLGLEYFKGVFRNYFLVALSYFIIAVIAWFAKPPLLLLFWVPVLTYLVIVIIDLIWVNKYQLSLQPSLKKIDPQKALSSVWPYFIFSVLSIFYFRFDVILLGQIQGDTAVAMYTAAFQFIEALILLPSSIGKVFFPHISKKMLNKNKWLKQYGKGLVYLFLVGSAVGAGIYLFTPFIINTFFGARYLPAVKVLRVYSLVCIFFFLNSVTSSVVIAGEKLKKYLVWYSFALAFAIIANLILIPRLSYLAPAWVKLATEVIFFTSGLLFIFLKIREE